jgi:hypothetical protein
MKLALGSNKINGIPKLTRSADGPRSILVVGTQMITISKKVKHDVRNDTVIHLLNNRRKSDSVLKNMGGTNQPTTNPRRIAKMGTPIPAPTAKISRKQKAKMGNKYLCELIFDIFVFL